MILCSIFLHVCQEVSFPILLSSKQLDGNQEGNRKGMLNYLYKADFIPLKVWTLLRKTLFSCLPFFLPHPPCLLSLFCHLSHPPPLIRNLFHIWFSLVLVSYQLMYFFLYLSLVPLHCHQVEMFLFFFPFDHYLSPWYLTSFLSYCWFKRNLVLKFYSVFLFHVIREYPMFFSKVVRSSFWNIHGPESIKG